MSATIAIVIPTYNSARTLRRCLESVSAQTMRPAAVVVVDNGSVDETVAIARAAGATVLQHGPERSAQRNFGWKSTTSDAVLFVDSDMVLTDGVVADSSWALADQGVAALVVPERSFGVGYLARCRALEKDLYLGNCAVEAARVFRREALAAVGGYDETLTACEDWDLADRVAAIAGRVGRIASIVWHDEGQLRLRTSFSKKRYYGRWLARYAATRTPQVRARPAGRIRRRELSMLATSPLRAAGLVTLKAVEVAGFAVGALDARREASA